MRPSLGSVRMFRSLFSIAVAALIFTAVGCGGGNADGFKGERGTVTGKLTYKGQPVPVGSGVVFQAKTGSFTAGGTVKENGEYTVLYEGKASMPAVEYQVQISPPPVAPATVDPATVATGASSTPPPPFPTKYFTASTSGLEFTVKAGANTANFDLVD